jgi:outer membrane protein assembly factor BamB
MKKYLPALVLLAAFVGASAGQEPARLYTHPLIPPPEVLARLDLQLSWRTFVSTLGKCDGILTVQILPDQILIQTFSGGVTAINPLDGSTIWRSRFGAPFRARYPLGYNSSLVFAYNGLRVFALDRRTGAVKWELAPFNAPTAGPVADDDRLYLVLSSGRMDVYELAKPTATGEIVTPPPGVTPPAGPTTAPPAVEAVPVGARIAWSYFTGARFERAPVLAAGYVVVIDTNGRVSVLSKEGPVPAYEFTISSQLTTPLTVFGDIVYGATDDGRAFAFNARGGSIVWRVSIQSLTLQRLAVTDDDVYLGMTVGGLSRLDRLSGEEIWRFRGGERFLGKNPIFVYAIDRDGRLTVLDRVRGTVLSAIDVRDYPVPILNDVTDQIFLAAHDGTLVCLRRGVGPPLSVRQRAEEPTPSQIREAGPAPVRTPASGEPAPPPK